jgi:hypothetical protein
LQFSKIRATPNFGLLIVFLIDSAAADAVVALWATLVKIYESIWFVVGAEAAVFADYWAWWSGPVWHSATILGTIRFHNE